MRLLMWELGETYKELEGGAWDGLRKKWKEESNVILFLYKMYKN